MSANDITMVAGLVSASISAVAWVASVGLLFVGYVTLRRAAY